MWRAALMCKLKARTLHTYLAGDDFLLYTHPSLIRDNTLHMSAILLAQACLFMFLLFPWVALLMSNEHVDVGGGDREAI